MSAQLKSADATTDGFCGTAGFIAPEVRAHEFRDDAAPHGLAAFMFSAGETLVVVLHRSGTADKEL